MSTNGQYQRYQQALAQMRYEGNLLWTIFRNFLWPHTIFLSVLTSLLPDAKLPGFDLRTWVLAGLGMFWCILWGAIFARNSAYYHFRMAQARRTEPDDWNLVKGEGERFSEGEKICMPDRVKPYQMPLLATVLTTGKAVPLFILSFALVYFVLSLLSGPSWCCYQRPLASEIGQC